MKKLAWMAAVALTAASIAQASVIVDVTESNSNVYFQWNGSLDLAGAVKYGGTMGGGANYVSTGISAFQLFMAGSNQRYSLSSGPVPSLGSTDYGYHYFDSASATAYKTFAFDSDGNYVTLAATNLYLSGGLLEGTSTLLNHTISGIGLQGGVYTWTLAGSGDKIVMNVVPEPSTWAMIGAGVLGLLAMRRRRA